MRHVDNPFKSPAILSLCTGMRGLERGIERVIGPLRIIADVEIESFVIENLVQQMEKGLLAPSPVFSNVKTFPFEKFRGRLHGIIGGYPCQPFSAAGLRKGEDDPRHLWPFIKRGIKKSQPQWVFFENVEGHLSLGFERVQKDLRQMGYAVEAGIFTAQEVGAPHRRARLFILGVEDSIVQRMRRGDYGQGEDREREVQTEGSGELEHTYSERFRHEQEEIGRDVRDNNRELEIPIERWEDNKQCGTGKSGADVEFCNIVAYSSGIHAQGYRNGSGEKQPRGSSELLAYCISQRLEGFEKQPAWKELQAVERSDGVDRWPARPNEEQYEWEEARTFPGVGFTVDGYSFREDLLRLLGNAVVEQSAELAFRTLLEKFK